jgi:hypothetical protein
MVREINQIMRFVVYDTASLHHFAIKCAIRSGQLDAFLEQHNQYIDDCRADGGDAGAESIALNDVDWLCEHGLAFDQDERQGFEWCESRTEIL